MIGELLSVFYSQVGHGLVLACFELRLECLDSSIQSPETLGVVFILVHFMIRELQLFLS